MFADGYDPMIPIHESYRVFDRYAGKKRWRVFPWKGHGISLFARPIDWLKEVSHFLDGKVPGFPSAKRWKRVSFRERKLELADLKKLHPLPIAKDSEVGAFP